MLIQTIDTMQTQERNDGLNHIEGPISSMEDLIHFHLITVGYVCIHIVYIYFYIHFPHL